MLGLNRIAASILVLTALAAPAAADVPNLVSYQGVLMQDDAVVVPDGLYSLRFQIFRQEALGSAVFEQTLQVQVTNGLYNVLLSDNGSSTLANAFSQTPAYMQVTVLADPPELPVDVVLDPRQQIASVPYALVAANASSEPPPPAPDPIPPGTIVAYGGSDLVDPPGWLVCNGRNNIVRNDYLDLFEAICPGGTNCPYGNGNGPTTFTLPDLRGRVPFGFKSGDADFSPMGPEAGKGSKTHDHTTGDAASGGVANPTANLNASVLVEGNDKYVARRIHKHDVNNATALPPYQVVNWIIKY